MEQDCFLTFGIYRQMIMMQPGLLSILPLVNNHFAIAIQAHPVDDHLIVDVLNIDDGPAVQRG